MNDFPNLKGLCTAYLNQDFDLEFGSADDAVRAYFAHAGVVEKLEIQNELTQLIAAQHSDDILRSIIFNDLGCCYFFPAEWQSAVKWLEHLKKLLDPVR